VYPFAQGALYRFDTAVDQITDITLQPGEQLIGSGPLAAGIAQGEMPPLLALDRWATPPSWSTTRPRSTHDLPPPSCA